VQISYEEDLKNSDKDLFLDEQLSRCFILISGKNDASESYSCLNSNDDHLKNLLRTIE